MMRTSRLPLSLSLSAVVLSALLLASTPAAAATKGDVPVRVSASTEGDLRSGFPLRVTLALRSTKPAQALTLRYETEGDLVLQSAADVQLVTDATGKASDTVTVTATQDGLHFVNVFVRVDDRLRVVSVPLRIGTASVAEKQTASPSRDGVVELKAKETVR